MGKYLTTNRFGEKIPVLLGITEAAEFVGHGLDRKKLKVYLDRDQFIEPSGYIGNRPFWTLRRVEQFTNMLLECKDASAQDRANIVKIMDKKGSKI